MAEGVGFEPTRRVTPPAGFQDRFLKPLGHPSTPVKSRPYRYILCQRPSNLRCCGRLSGLICLVCFETFHLHNFAFSGVFTSILGRSGALWEVPLQTIKLFGATEILMMTVGVLLITALTFLL